MGVSTDGMIFFGILLDDDVFDTEDDTDDWACMYARLAQGITCPDVEYEGNQEVFSEFWKKVREAVEHSLCSIGYHCSDSYPAPYVALSRANLNASRGYPEELDVEMFKVTEEEIQAIKDFCEVLGVPYSTPKWYLASFWG